MTINFQPVQKFCNPTTKRFAQIDPFSLLLCALFGPIYFLVKRNWLHAFAMLALSVLCIYALGFPLAAYVYPFFVYPINRAKYFKDGYMKRVSFEA